LTGVVSDPSHAVVPNTVVELRDETKGTIQTSKTDGDGVYQFFFLAPGKYSLSVSHAGFRGESHDVSVLLGPPGKRNLTLEIVGGTETVKVTGEMPQREPNRHRAVCLGNYFAVQLTLVSVTLL
jgi:Carboxypeptidase regulatory-like domain